MEAAKAPRRPPGRLAITAAQLAAEVKAQRAGPKAGTGTPGKALAAFKRAEPALGVAVQVAKLVDYLVGCTRAQDWSGEGVLGPIAWPSDVELEERLGVGPSQRKAIVRGALDAGYVRMRRSPTGKRWGVRDKAGHIREAYGFDLTPLLERQAEFEQLAAEYQVRREEGRRLRREISRTRGDVLALVALATDRGLGAEDWQASADQANALMQARGRHRDPLALVPLAARMKAVHLRLKAAVEAALLQDDGASSQPAEIPPRSRNTDPTIQLQTNLQSLIRLQAAARRTDQRERREGEGTYPAQTRGPCSDQVMGPGRCVASLLPQTSFLRSRQGLGRG